MHLVACPSCARHVRGTDTRCPFCGYAKRLSPGAVLAVAAASWCAAACKPEAPRNEPSPVASPSTSPPSPVPTATASSDLGRIELGRAAVYGAPPPPASSATRPRGSVSVEALAPAAGAPANAERVVRAMIPGFRACYNRALQTHAEEAAKLQAKLRLTIHVGPGGEVTSATVAPEKPELAAPISCIRARATAALFEATGKASVITAELTLALAP